jgi:uridine kinase
MKTIVLGIAGGSGSGKTTVAENITKRLEPGSVILLDHDSYYKDQSHLPVEERTKINYDHPEALDNDLLCKHLQDLKEGLSIKKPVYDFVTYTRLAEVVPIAPAKVVILEGFLIFTDPRIRDLTDIKIFVDTDDDIRIIRRIERDMRERKRSLESIIKQYLDSVKPMHHRFVEPTKRYADIIIPWGGHNKIAIDMVVARIRSLLKSEGH